MINPNESRQNQSWNPSIVQSLQKIQFSQSQAYAPPQAQNFQLNQDNIVFGDEEEEDKQQEIQFQPSNQISQSQLSFRFENPPQMKPMQAQNIYGHQQIHFQTPRQPPVYAQSQIIQNYEEDEQLEENQDIQYEQQNLRSQVQQPCFKNLKCKKQNCKFTHDTEDGKSPALQPSKEKASGFTPGQTSYVYQKKQASSQIENNKIDTIECSFDAKMAQWYKIYEKIKELKVEFPEQFLRYDQKQEGDKTKYVCQIKRDEDGLHELVKQQIKDTFFVKEFIIQLPFRDRQQVRDITFETINLAKALPYGLFIDKNYAELKQELHMKCLQINEHLGNQFKQRIEEIISMKNCTIFVLDYFEESPQKKYMAFFFFETFDFILVNILESVDQNAKLDFEKQKNQIKITIQLNSKDQVVKQLKDLSNELYMLSKIVFSYIYIFDTKWADYLEKLKNDFRVVVKQQLVVSTNDKGKKKEVKEEEEIKANQIPTEKKKYSICVMGMKQDCEDCWKELESFLQSRTSTTRRIKLDEIIQECIAQNEESIKQLKEQYDIEIFYKKGMLTLFGEQSNFDSVIKSLKGIQIEENKNKQVTVAVPIPQGSYQRLLYKAIKKNEILGTLEEMNNTPIVIYDDKLEVTGKKLEVQNTQFQLQAFLEDLRSNVREQYFSKYKYTYLIQKFGEEMLGRKFGLQITDVTQEKELPPVFIPNVKVAEESVKYYQWSYKVFKGDQNYDQRTDTKEDFFDFDADQNWQIEQQYRSACQRKDYQTKREIIGDQGKLKNGFSYLIWGENGDSTTWKEMNKETERVRGLRRVQLQQEPEQEEEKYEEEMSMLSNFADIYRSNKQNDDDDELSLKYLVVGLKENIDNMKTYLKSEMSKAENYKNVKTLDKQFVKQYSVQLKEFLNKMIPNLGCQFSFNANQLTITGHKGKQAIDKVDDFYGQMRNQKFPQAWEKVVELIEGNKVYVNVELKKGAQEWKDIEKSFMVTMQGYEIVKIERVQNRLIWNLYAAERENMILQGNKNPTELNLFHGTRNTDPRLIFSGREGFDMRFSNPGMWGQAIYFAVKAIYSNDYRHELSNNQFQMFFARVLIGETIVLNPDRSLRMPPINSTTQRMYDSVQGFTNNSDVYMIYANKQAYPEYLITYKQKI